MDLRIDDRGKYFTPRVSKESIVAAIRTTDHFVTGMIYVRPDQRLKDELNLSQERFIAVTDARIYDAQGTTVLFESSFLAIASAQIIFITPMDAVKRSPQLCWLPSEEQEGTV